MGRGRGKGKKPTIGAARGNTGSGEEEKIPAHRKRGRPLKPLKDNSEEEEEEAAAEKTGGGEYENGKDFITIKDMRTQAASENGKKRKRSSQVKESSDKVKESGAGNKSSIDDSVKPVGFRQTGSRRKSTPRRAAEVGVECW